MFGMALVNRLENRPSHISLAKPKSMSTIVPHYPSTTSPYSISTMEYGSCRATPSLQGFYPPPHSGGQSHSLARSDSPGCTNSWYISSRISAWVSTYILWGVYGSWPGWTSSRTAPPPLWQCSRSSTSSSSTPCLFHHFVVHISVFS